MGKYIKGALKVLGDYSITLLIFLFFSYPFFKHLRIYSFVIFIITALLVYADMHKLAIKEKRPQYNLNPHPLNGLAYGILGYLPVLVLILVYPLINITTSVINFANLKHLLLNALMGPLFFLLKFGNETTQAYFLAWCIIPVIAMLGYLAGFYGFEVGSIYRKFVKVNPNKAAKPDVRKR
jgi:hypothetical protein